MLIVVCIAIPVLWNECEDVLLNDCEDICIDEVYGYSCNCSGGATLNSDGKTCSGKKSHIYLINLKANRIILLILSNELFTVNFKASNINDVKKDFAKNW